MTSARELKAALRTAALSRRDALNVAERIEMSLAAGEHALPFLKFSAGTVVSGFLPIRSEIDLRPLMHELRSRGAMLALPVVQDRQTIVFREFRREAKLVDTGFGTIGPGPEAKVLDPQILLMPLSAFDRLGNRIGYGAGHYDRAIGRLRAKGIEPGRIGFGFGVQEVDLIPAEPHDVGLEAVVTESGVRQFTA